MIPIARPWLPPLEEYVRLLEEIWHSRMLSNFGELSQRLERAAEAYLGAHHVLATSSGDAGLIITLRALDLPEGAPCFMSDFTFNSTINAALWNRLRPVLVDIDRSTLNLSPGALEGCMERNPQPGVVLATHVFGNPCDTGALKQAASAHGSYLVFDAAHGYGSRRDGRHVGTFGDAEVFSLSGTKPVTTAEGGLISTPHGWLAGRVRFLRAYGFQSDYISEYVGINAKLSELHAALGLLTLPEIEVATRRRHEIRALYLQELEGIASGQGVRSEDRSTFKDVVLNLGSSRADVESALTQADIQAKRYFVPLHTMDIYSAYGEGPYINSDHAYAETLCVPAFTEISDETVKQICSCIQSAARG